jgi:ribosomal protein S18 acetylase RimI-like enzyme
MRIRPYQESDESAVVDLWQVCLLTRPWNDPQEDIARKLQVQREWFLVGTIEERLVASVMAGYDGHRGWINYLAVHPDFRGRSLGRSLMRHVEQLLLEAGCPKISLLVRTGNETAVAFYKELGFGQDDVVCLGKRIIADPPRS